MEYYPRYPQPFTLAEAAALDTAVITEEIARLQNSLLKLKETQESLRNYIEQTKESEGPADPEIVLAYEENEDTIGSQEERVSMLNMALVQKGINVDNGHYALPTKSDESKPTETALADQQEDNDQGVYL